MPFPATVIRMMIGSPGDVEERGIVAEAIASWNAQHAESSGIMLMPLRWELDSAPVLGSHAQEIINGQVVERSDALIAAFWSRLGSPTPNSESGTMEEIERHVKAGKPVMVYFCSRAVPQSKLNPDQYGKLLAAKDRLRKSGLIEEYGEPHELKEKLLRQLTIIVKEKFGNLITAAGGPSASGLSVDAKRLLKAGGAQGEIQYLEVIGGPIIRAGGKSFYSGGDARERARWEAALAELINAGMVTRNSTGAINRLNKSGFDLADTLPDNL